MRGIAILVLCAFATLGGCAPDGAWSRPRVQAWAERSFPLGTSGEDVRAGLEERRVRFSDRRNSPGEEPVIRAWFGAPAWWVLSVKLVTFSEPTTGVTFRFDASDHLQSIEAWKEFDGL